MKKFRRNNDLYFNKNGQLKEISKVRFIWNEILDIINPIQSVYNLGEVIEGYENKFKNANFTGEREQQIRSKLNSLKDAFNSYSVTEIIKKYVPLDVKKFFVFCPNKDELKAMKPIVVNWFNMAGFEDIHVFDVHSDLTSKDSFLSKVETLDKYKYEVDVLKSNINEGEEKEMPILGILAFQLDKEIDSVMKSM